MREQKSGYIINICSIAALSPVAEAGSYTVTKFALHGLTKVLRLELMRHNVKVTAILPGSTLTSYWEGTTLPEDCFVAAEDIANAVMYCLNTKGGANPDEIVISPLSGQI
jgi:short-subunit dehydrogenase